MTGARYFVAVAGVGVFAIAGMVALGRMETAKLNYERQALREQNARWADLRAENARLRSGQIATEELERLRADHVALPRLRAEIEALKKGLGATGAMVRPHLERAGQAGLLGEAGK